MCVFITFDAYSYDVLRALEGPSRGIQALATPVPRLRTLFINVDRAVDVTSRLRAVMEHLD